MLPINTVIYNLSYFGLHVLYIQGVWTVDGIWITGQLNSYISYYIPGIYAEGYIVFVFLFICSFICSFVRISVLFVELLQSFTFRRLEWRISHQPLIRKHSYLDHRYPGGSTFIPWLLTPGSMLCFSTFLLWKFVPMLNLVTWTCGSWSEGQHDLYFTVQWSVISWGLFDVCIAYFRSMTQYDMTFDLKINVGHCDLCSIVQWFALYLEDYLMYEQYYLGLWQYDPKFDLKRNIGQDDLYFMVQWFLPYILKTIWCMYIILWEYESVHPDVWPKS